MSRPSGSRSARWRWRPCISSRPASGCLRDRGQERDPGVAAHRPGPGRPLHARAAAVAGRGRGRLRGQRPHPGVPRWWRLGMALGNTAEALLGAPCCASRASSPRCAGWRRAPPGGAGGDDQHRGQRGVGTLSLRMGGLLPPGRIAATLRECGGRGILMGALIITPARCSRARRDSALTIPPRLRVLERWPGRRPSSRQECWAFHRPADEVSYSSANMQFPALLWRRCASARAGAALGPT
jgi:hypothetical protein